MTNLNDIELTAAIHRMQYFARTIVAMSKGEQEVVGRPIEEAIAEAKEFVKVFDHAQYEAFKHIFGWRE